MGDDAGWGHLRARFLRRVRRLSSVGLYDSALPASSSLSPVTRRHRPPHLHASARRRHAGAACTPPRAGG
eukprot:512481-Rhodomonas_salina.1